MSEKNYMRCAGIALLGLLIWTPAMQAQEPIATNDATPATEEAAPEHGKLNTADASPVDPGHFELETTYTYISSRHFWTDEGDHHARGLAQGQILGFAATAGIMADVDVAIRGGYTWLEDEENDFNPEDGVLGPQYGQGFTDVEISGRYRFLEDKINHFELAYIGGITIPTGSSPSREAIGTSQEFWSFNQSLVVSKDWEKWTANGDIGYALPLGEKRSHAQGTFKADAAVGYQIRPWLQPEVELNYSHDFFSDENGRELLAATIGLVMPINDRIRVNTGVQQGLWGRNADQTTSVLVAVKLAL